MVMLVAAFLIDAIATFVVGKALADLTPFPYDALMVYAGLTALTFAAMALFLRLAYEIMGMAWCPRWALHVYRWVSAGLQVAAIVLAAAWICLYGDNLGRWPAHEPAAFYQAVKWSGLYATLLAVTVVMYLWPVYGTAKRRLARTVSQP